VGVLEDGPIKVEDLYVPVNFVILEIAEDMCTPVILRRLILVTLRCRIDVKNSRLSFDMEFDHVEFNLFKASKCPYTSDECHTIVIDNLVREEVTNHVLVAHLSIVC